MGMLAEQADYVIGVDTHRDAHAAAAIAVRTGTVWRRRRSRPTRSATGACCASRASTRERVACGDRVQRQLRFGAGDVSARPR